MKIINKIPYLISISFVILLFVFVNCGTEDEPAPENPVIAGYDKIELQAPDHDSDFSSAVSSSNRFLYDAPDGVDYMTFYLFNCPSGSCDTDIVQDGAIDITNPNFVAFSDTDHTMGQNQLNIGELFEITGGSPLPWTTYYNPGGTDNYQWFIVGYDSGGQPFAASPERYIRIAW